MKHWIRRMALLAIGAFMMVLLSAAAEGTEPYTDVVILSTTDLHGKCWDTNVLTGQKEEQNILRVSTAVKEYRETYGEQQVLLIDNGDLFQGTLVSEHQLLQKAKGLSDVPPAMALCVREIGYTACVLGNHEFDYPWGVMHETYEWLENGGVPVLAANICHDGTLEGTQAGENAFTPYIICPVMVNGHEHKIGILGLENVDIPRWNLPEYYPGLQFVHPDNERFSMTWEANLYLPEMKEKGCEFIIVSYHGGLGDTDSELEYGVNSERQAMRLITESSDIDLMINGHDHSTGYSGSMIQNADGRKILVVNGGGQEMTHTVLRFSENEDSGLVWEVLENGNLDLRQYAADESLREKVQPYAEMAETYAEQPVSMAVGEWDGNRAFYTEQTDTMDLVALALIESGTQRVQALAERCGAEAVMKCAGTDHLDIDMVIGTAVVAGGYTVNAGPVSMKDIYRMYRYANSILTLPMTGAQIRAVMEEHAAERLSVRMHDGQTYIYEHGDLYTHLIFGGLNYTCDLAKTTGEKNVIEGFSNGRAFDDDAVYLVEVSNYILSNSRCGLRAFSEENTLEGMFGTEGESATELIHDYLKCHEQITQEDVSWHWENICSGETEPGIAEDEAGAEMLSALKDGEKVIIFHEAEQCTITEAPLNGGLDRVSWKAQGSALVGPRPETAVVFTVHAEEDDVFRFCDAQGRWLYSGGSGSLDLIENPEREELSRWRVEPARGGWYILSTRTDRNIALQLYAGRFTTFEPDDNAVYIFNFYEPVK